MHPILHALLASSFVVALAGCSKPTGSDLPRSDVGDTSPDIGTDLGNADSDGGDMCAEPSPAPFVLSDARGEASVAIAAGSDCDHRTYRLTSTAARRDDAPASPRVVAELQGWPRLRTGNAMLDGLYAMTLEEVRQCSVDAISNGGFRNGEAIACPAGGCFETGEKWSYVWTRDIAYATDLGLAELDPTRAANSLAFKVSPPRGGGEEQVMQDTGTGGSYPVSTDRVVWALGARAVLMQLADDEATDYASWAFDVLVATLRHDRAVVVDERTGLYFGEQSFLDWREQSYPAWVAQNPMHIATSRALSTNLLHLRAMEIAVELAQIAGRTDEATELSAWANALREAIAERFWLEESGLFSAFFATYLDETPSRQFDLLGNALAVSFDVATNAQADQVLAAYPHVGPGAPVLFPEQQFTPIYHNRAEWPFVSAYWLRAAEGRNDAVTANMFESLIRGAATNLSNMENWEISSRAPWVDDGDYSGPVVNSRRQLWSVAAFVSMIHRSTFGLEPSWNDGPSLAVAPVLPASVAENWFGDRTEVELRGYRYRGLSIDVVLELPASISGTLVADIVTVDGRPVEGGEVAASMLTEGSVIRARLRSETSPTVSLTSVSDTDWRDLFAPRTPRVTVERDSAGVRVTFDSDDDAADLTWNVHRDGGLVAQLTGVSEWSDPDAPTTGSPCYVVESCFVGSGNCSQHSDPVCLWDAVDVYGAADFEARGGAVSDQFDRLHWSGGAAGEGIVVRGVRPGRSGRQLLQLEYGNSHGAVESGITCGVLAVRVVDELSGDEVSSGVVLLPHLGADDRWAYSSFVPVEMSADRIYRVEVINDGPKAMNMSRFVHFAAYTGGSGGLEPVNGGRISELRVLSL